MRQNLLKQIQNRAWLLPFNIMLFNLMLMLNGTKALAQGDGPENMLNKLQAASQTPPPPAEEPLPYSALITNPRVIAWWALILILWWIVSVAFTAVFSKRNYPPNVAALACWLSFSGFVLCFLTIILGKLMHHTFGTIVWLLVGAGILILFIITIARRSPNTR